jgi:hypothetical protein
MTSPNSTPPTGTTPASTAKRAFPVRPKWIALLLVVLVLAYLTMQFPVFQKKAELGSAYAAQVGCSCHFIEDRNMGSCETDLEEAAWMVSMTAEDSKGTVTGSVPLLASRTAQHSEVMGCQLQAE